MVNTLEVRKSVRVASHADEGALGELVRLRFLGGCRTTSSPLSSRGLLRPGYDIIDAQQKHTRLKGKNICVKKDESEVLVIRKCPLMDLLSVSCQWFCR